MERMDQLVGTIPPISRTWLAAIVVVSVATSNSIVEPIRIVFMPSKVVSEPWRLVTLFCYFGPLSFSLVQNLLLISHSTSVLETTYYYDISMIPHSWTRRLDDDLIVELKADVEKYKMLDFAYFVVQVAAFIVVASSVMYTIVGFSGTALMFLGPILERCLLYIWCRTTPEGDLVVLGFPVKAKHALWVTQVLFGLLSEDFGEITASFRVGFVQGMRTFITCEFVTELMVVFFVGHFWWFLRYYLVGEVYNDGKTETRRNMAAAYASVVSWENWVKVFASTLVTPPWYWVICRKLQNEQIIRERVQAISNERNERNQENEGVDGNENDNGNTNELEDVNGNTTENENEIENEIENVNENESIVDHEAHENQDNEDEQHVETENERNNRIGNERSARLRRLDINAVHDNMSPSNAGTRNENDESHLEVLSPTPTDPLPE